MRLMIKMEFSIKMKVITMVKTRSASMSTCCAVDDQSRLLKVNIYNEKFVNLKTNSFYLVKNCQLNTKNGEFYMIINAKSQVFSTSTFIVDAKVEREFLNAPLCNVSEALSSPQKRRLTIDAEVLEVFPVAIGDNSKWTRRDIVVNDGGPSPIKLKLWNEHAEKAINVGEQVRFMNMAVDVFKNQRCLNSTDETVVEVSIGIAKQKTIVIDGVSEEELEISVSTEEGKTMTMSSFVIFGGLYEGVEYDQKFNGFDDLCAQLPIKCDCSIVGNRITELNRVV